MEGVPMSTDLQHRGGARRPACSMEAVPMSTDLQHHGGARRPTCSMEAMPTSKVLQQHGGARRCAGSMEATLDGELAAPRRCLQHGGDARRQACSSTEAMMSTHASIPVESVGPPKAESYRFAALSSRNRAKPNQVAPIDHPEEKEKTDARVPPLRRLSAGQTAASRRSFAPAAACSSAPIPFAQPQGRADPDHHPFVLTPDAEPSVVIADAIPDPTLCCAPPARSRPQAVLRRYVLLSLISGCSLSRPISEHDVSRSPVMCVRYI
ncbi:hypothetical protein QYE76_047419 [Lolium multiflorum]|uniref:Uncharacterized protein n=1 Tax=Lolium multiflorum TaxID=4521 RepID=A0AAD8TQC2_LOLMU|nr:hypothetical protein QYE76_047419 [Lolium multiflorum]